MPAAPRLSPLPSRRDLLHAGLGALAFAAASPIASAVFAQNKAQQKKDAAGKAAAAGFIDAHSHIWTPDTAKYPLAKGFKKEDMKPASFTPEELMRHAKPEGVSRVVLIQMSFYGFDNSYMLGAIQAHPQAYVGVAVIDENDTPAEKMRELKKLGVRGFRIRPGERKADAWLAGDGMAAMWKRGAEENLAMCCLIDAKFLPSVDRMCQKHPETPLVIDHFARIGVDGEIRETDLANLCQLAQHKRTSVKISAYYALGKKKSPYKDLVPMIRRLLDAFGPERLMWASDCPFQVQEGHTYKESIDLIKNLDVPEGDRQWLLRKTAEKVFFG
ncbi:MAG: amidohydrolase family protein [Planctomycetia bacterium]|nr:amidohydrolase family protein [Planctomycetia bacterium]